MIALAAIGSWGCCSVTCCDKKPRNQLILVSPAADAVQPDTAVISKMAHEEIVWKLPAGSTITNVAIELAGKPAPFVSCQTAGGLCHIACANALCVSGPIDPSLSVPTKPGPYYAYHFEKSPAQASSDPGIRIDP
jgi:hypothetical protein